MKHLNEWAFREGKRMMLNGVRVSENYEVWCDRQTEIKKRQDWTHLLTHLTPMKFSEKTSYSPYL